MGGRPSRRTVPPLFQPDNSASFCFIHQLYGIHNSATQKNLKFEKPVIGPTSSLTAGETEVPREFTAGLG